MSYRVTRFISVGIINTATDFILLNLLVFGVGLPKVPANIVSTSVAMSLSYVLNHGFVFRAETNKTKRQFLLFIAVTSFGLFVLQNSIIFALTHLFEQPAFTIYDLIIEPLFGARISRDFVELNFAKAIATLASLVWNYQMYKRVVFKKASSSQDETLSDQRHQQ